MRNEENAGSPPRPGVATRDLIEEGTRTSDSGSPPGPVSRTESDRPAKSARRAIAGYPPADFPPRLEVRSAAVRVDRNDRSPGTGLLEAPPPIPIAFVGPGVWIRADERALLEPGRGPRRASKSGSK